MVLRFRAMTENRHLVDTLSKRGKSSMRDSFAANANLYPLLSG